jgi:hypothetical protein
MYPATNNSTSSHRDRHRLRASTTDKGSIPPVQSDLHRLIYAHTDLCRAITDRLLARLSPSTTPTVQLLSVQDQIALLRRLSENAQADLPGCRDTGAVIIACSTALTVADSMIFRSITTPSETSPRILHAAVTALEESLAQLETLLPAIPITAPGPRPTETHNP